MTNEHDNGNDPGQRLRRVLLDAQERTQQEIKNLPATASSRPLGIAFGRLWIGSLHDAFWHEYQGPATCVFSRERPAAGPCAHWRRNEYLHDVCVAEAHAVQAPYRTRQSVPVLTRIMWQVESEVALNGMSVAEDLGKLVAGSAENKLLVVGQPSKRLELQKWIDFIGIAAKFVPNEFYLAVMPTYASKAAGHVSWVEGKADIRVYRRQGIELREQSLITFPPPS